MPNSSYELKHIVVHAQEHMTKSIVAKFGIDNDAFVLLSFDYIINEWKKLHC